MIFLLVCSTWVPSLISSQFWIFPRRKIALNQARLLFHMRNFESKITSFSSICEWMPLTRSSSRVFSHTEKSARRVFFLFDETFHCEDAVEPIQTRIFRCERSHAASQLVVAKWKCFSHSLFSCFSVSNFIYDPFGLWLHSKMHERITPEVDLWLSQEAEWKSKNLIFHCSWTWSSKKKLRPDFSQKYCRLFCQ